MGEEDQRCEECESSWAEEIYWNHFQDLHFCQVLANDDFHHQLVLPMKFARVMSSRVPKVVSLKAPCGFRWNVNVTVSCDSLSFRDGWEGFAKAFSLEKNDILIFKYNGQSSLDVLIFDGKNLCEKEAVYFVKKCENAKLVSANEKKRNSREVTLAQHADPDCPPKKPRNVPALESIASRPSDILEALPVASDKPDFPIKKPTSVAAEAADASRSNISELIPFGSCERGSSTWKPRKVAGVNEKKRNSREVTLARHADPNCPPKKPRNVAALELIALQPSNILEALPVASDKPDFPIKKRRSVAAEAADASRSNISQFIAFGSHERDFPTRKSRNVAGEKPVSSRKKCIRKAMPVGSGSPEFPTKSSTKFTGDREPVASEQPNTLEIIPIGSGYPEPPTRNSTDFAGDQEPVASEQPNTLEIIPVGLCYPESPTKNYSTMFADDQEPAASEQPKTLEVIPVGSDDSDSPSKNSRNIDLLTLYMRTPWRSAPSRGRRKLRHGASPPSSWKPIVQSDGKKKGRPKKEKIAAAQKIVAKAVAEKSSHEAKRSKKRGQTSAEQSALGGKGGTFMKLVIKGASKSGGRTCKEAGSQSRRKSVILSTRRPVTEVEKEKAFMMAVHESTEDSFINIMRPWCVYTRFYTTIPAKWFAKHFSPQNRQVILRVGEKTWMTRLYYSEGKKAGGLSAGWKTFVLDNRLEESDVCLFKLCSHEPIVLDVSIFRVVPEPITTPPSLALVVTSSSPP
ncbi:hypothetical protein Dimus_021842 [Dionaea muscipula]